jgi:Na+-transporting methylmalonyl-CoA/oxaloacetate decarboxylase beta subunit
MLNIHPFSRNMKKRTSIVMMLFCILVLPGSFLVLGLLFFGSLIRDAIIKFKNMYVTGDK